MLTTMVMMVMVMTWREHLKMMMMTFAMLLILFNVLSCWYGFNPLHLPDLPSAVQLIIKNCCCRYFWISDHSVIYLGDLESCVITNINPHHLPSSPGLPLRTPASPSLLMVSQYQPTLPLSYCALSGLAMPTNLSFLPSIAQYQWTRGEPLLLVWQLAIPVDTTHLLSSF